MNDRKFGILMPVSCLPSDEGIGTMGRHAYKFIDFLHECGGRIWQVLPLNPTNYGDSPYQSCSSNALNYYFIDLATLVAQGLLRADEIDYSRLVGEDERRVDYGKQFNYKIPLLKLAFSRFKRDSEFEEFVRGGEYADFAVFMALKEKFGHAPFDQWDEPYRSYDSAVVGKFIADNAESVLFWHFTQFVFLKQWNALRAYAHAHNIEIMGDIPLYIAYDSAEMWKYGDKIFQVEGRRPVCVAGCPPDGFSEDGQLWGNPIYDWQKMKKDNFSWWGARIDGCFKLYDILRIDHFRGFDRYYAIPYGHKNARNGHWEDGPKEELFKGRLDKKIVAEDLGVIDDGVLRLMKNVGYPGMKILMFAFDGRKVNEHKPSNYTHNYVCYTGTHDNQPLKSYVQELGKQQLKTYLEDLDSECVFCGIKADTDTVEDICRTVMRLAFASPADTVILPLSDVLIMGDEARMNLPSTVSPANWSWRFLSADFSPACLAFLRDNAMSSGRA